jgi:hypothetical protein
LDLKGRKTDCRENDELHSLYSSTNIVRVIKSRRLRWAGHVARMEEGRGVCRVFVGTPEGKRPLGRPRRRWEDNIKLDLREIRIDGANWIWLAQDTVQWWAFVNTVMNLRVPYEEDDGGSTVPRNVVYPTATLYDVKSQQTST